MKFISIVTIAACLVNLGCNKNKNISDDPDAFYGKVITEDFLKTNSGTFMDSQQSGIFTIYKDGTFQKISTAQVGRDGEKIPYPTLCRYSEFGKIEKVFDRNEKSKKTIWTMQLI